MEANWKDDDGRPKFVLKRIAGSNFDILCVKRNESDEGEFVVELNMRVDGEHFEASTTQVDSPETMSEVVKAFYDRDASIKTMIEWDVIVE